MVTVGHPVSRAACTLTSVRMSTALFAVVISLAAVAERGQASGRLRVQGSEAHPITVSPRSGGAHAAFAIRFTSHARLGRHHGFALTYELDTFEGNRHPTVGCEGSFGDAIRRGQAGQRLEFRERPTTPGGWCPARYRATIRLVATYPCAGRPDELLCNPRAKELIGRVTWTVRTR